MASSFFNLHPFTIYYTPFCRFTLFSSSNCQLRNFFFRSVVELRAFIFLVHANLRYSPYFTILDSFYSRFSCWSAKIINFELNIHGLMLYRRFVLVSQTSLTYLTSHMIEIMLFIVDLLWFARAMSNFFINTVNTF